MKFSIKDFSSKCDQIRRKKSLMEKVYIQFSRYRWTSKDILFYSQSLENWNSSKLNYHCK